jgi:hypothetical protein
MNEKFTYLIENISRASPTLFEMILGVIIMSIFMVCMRYVFLYGYGLKLVSKDTKELRRKRETLSDLILMKDIQTELEKEIEQAMLKATFQG